MPKVALRAMITAIVVTFNEGKRLPACLDSLAFCDQRIVIDLGSDDNSIAVAQAHGAEVHEHPRVLVVEQVRASALPHARHDWLLFLDPDEVITPRLADQLQLLVNDGGEIGSIEVPWQFYFQDKPLTTTIWGRSDSSKRILFHRERVELRPYVHKGYKVHSDFRNHSIPRQDGNVIEHYWMDDYVQLHEKHTRYLTQEGSARFAAGFRFSWLKAVGYTVGALLLNLIRYRGILGGRTGIYLSAYHSWYTWRCWLALRNYQMHYAPR